jgi:hypothetical protein
MNFLEIDFKMKRKVCAYRKKQKYVCLDFLSKHLISNKVPYCIPCIKDDALLYEEYFKVVEKIEQEKKTANEEYYGTFGNGATD